MLYKRAYFRRKSETQDGESTGDGNASAHVYTSEIQDGVYIL